MTVDAIPESGPSRLPLRVDTAYVSSALWIMFIFATSMAVWQHVSDNAERFAWLLADAICAVLLLRHQSQFINLSLSNPVFMSWPLIACASAAWSVAPGLSLYQGIQLLMTTLIPFLFCIQFRLEQIVAIFFWAMLLAAVVTVASVVVTPQTALDFRGNWQGGFPTKNVMGDAMVLLVVSAVCLFLQGRWRRVTAAAIVLGLFLIFMSRAATPILSVFMTLAPVPFAYALLRGRASFLMLLGVTLVTGTVLGTGVYVAATYFDFDPIGIVLESVGKDRTLTGRTLLWELANQAIDSKPWLGFGYNAYWADPPSAMRQVHMAFGQTISFFHNNFLEATVAFGILGPILLLWGMIIALVRTVLGVLRAVEPIEIWPFLIILQVFIQTPVQYPLMANHSTWMFLFIVAAVARR